jgi:hypothetical protein
MSVFMQVLSKGVRGPALLTIYVSLMVSRKAMVSLLISLFYLAMGLSRIFEKRRKFSGGLS